MQIHTGLKAMGLAKGLSEREGVGLAFLLSSKGAALIKSTPGANSFHALPPGYPDLLSAGLTVQTTS